MLTYTTVASIEHDIDTKNRIVNMCPIGIVSNDFRNIFKKRTVV